MNKKYRSRVLKYMRTYGKDGTTIGTVSRELNVTKHTARRYLLYLQKEGIVRVDKYSRVCKPCTDLAKGRLHAHKVFFVAGGGEHYYRHFGGDTDGGEEEA